MIKNQKKCEFGNTEKLEDGFEDWKLERATRQENNSLLEPLERAGHCLHLYLVPVKPILDSDLQINLF